MNGTFYLGFDSSSQNVLISTLTSGAAGTGYWRDNATPNWTISGIVQRPSWRVSCSGPAQFSTPSLNNSGAPILGASYNVLLSDAVALSAAFVLTGLTDTAYQGTPLPAPIPGAPGCDIYAAPEVTQLILTSGIGTAASLFHVPNDPGFVGVDLFHQWAILDAVNPVGIVVSDAGQASIDL